MYDRPRRPLTTVVVPVRDEDPLTVAALLAALRAYGWDLVVVDDGSVVPVVGATVRHATPRGYGAALKTGIRLATTELVATMDGDGQHRPRDVRRLEEFLLEFPENAMVVGDRRVQETTLSRWWGRKALNWLASLFAWRFLPDLNSGLRMMKRSVVLGYEPILSNGFSFTTSITLAMLADGYGVDWVPIRVVGRPQGRSHVQVWRDGWRTLRQIVVIGGACRTRRVRAWLRRRRG